MLDARRRLCCRFPHSVSGGTATPDDSDPRPGWPGSGAQVALVPPTDHTCATELRRHELAAEVVVRSSLTPEVINEFLVTRRLTEASAW